MKSLKFLIRGSRDEINFNFSPVSFFYSPSLSLSPSFSPPRDDSRRESSSSRHSSTGNTRRNRWKLSPARIIERKWASIPRKRATSELPFVWKGFRQRRKLKKTYFSNVVQTWHRWDMPDIFEQVGISSRSNLSFLSFSSFLSLSLSPSFSLSPPSHAPTLEESEETSKWNSHG